MHPIRGYETFLKWALVNVLFALALVAAFVSYHGKVEAAGKIAIAVVLVVYVAASAYAGSLAWRYRRLGLSHISLAIELSPMIAMLGTVGGFLIAFGSSAGDVQQRVVGASTGLAATLVGIACTIVLMIQRHIIEES